MKRISVEVFVAPGCACTHESMRRQFDRIAKEIEEKYKIKINLSYIPVVARRARELGVSKANTVVVNDRIVLEGSYSEADALKKVEAAVKAAKNII